MYECERRLIVSHRFICSLLDLHREKGFWFTGGKAWDCIKWNYGNVAISRRAVNEWFSRPEISSYRFPAERLGGRRGSRAFVAEHMYPTRSLQALVLARFLKKILQSTRLLICFFGSTGFAMSGMRRTRLSIEPATEAQCRAVLMKKTFKYGTPRWY